MRQGCGRFKATANELPVSMDKNRLSVSVFHGYNSIGMKRAFQALPMVNSKRPKFTPIPFSYKAHAILTQNAPRKNFCIFSRRRLSHIRFDVHRPCVVAQHFLQNGFNAAGILWYNTAEVFPERFTEAFNERLQTTISYDGSNHLSDCRNRRTCRSYYCPPRRHDQPASEA